MINTIKEIIENNPKEQALYKIIDFVENIINEKTLISFVDKKGYFHTQKTITEYKKINEDD